MVEVALVTAAVALLSGLFAILPPTKAGRRKVLFLVIGPLALLALGINWQLLRLGLGLQETCEPDCVAPGDVRAARAIFLAAAVLWIAVVLTWLATRRRRTERARGERIKSP